MKRAAPPLSNWVLEGVLQHTLEQPVSYHLTRALLCDDHAHQAFFNGIFQRMKMAVRLFSWIFLIALAGCTASRPTLAKIDLADPGWEYWNGQALWKPASERPALGGDLIAARHSNGDIMVNFSKSPLSIVTAQKIGSYWHIDFSAAGRYHSGKGKPPHRIIWFRIPALLGGASAPEGWVLGKTADGEWTILNPRTGEMINMVID
jgi:hypothetical protein